MTRIMSPSHEDQYTLMIISHSSLLSMRNVSDKFVEEIKKKSFSVTFIKSLSIYEIM